MTMTSHQLLLNYSMALVCDQWVMFWCDTSSYGGPSVPSQACFWAIRSSQKSLETSNQCEPLWKQFAAMTPHQLLLNHSMALVCDQSAPSSWWTSVPNQDQACIWARCSY
jgi:hypothetical protein